MLNLKEEKINFKKYFGTRRYKISFWGLNPQVDWFILIVYVAIGFVSILSWGYFDYKKAESEINQEVFVKRAGARFDISKAEEMLLQYNQKEEGVVAPVDQNR